MSQSWFSLGFLSQNSLWKLLTFLRDEGIYSRVCEECEKSFFYKIAHSGESASWLERVASLSREITARPDCTFCLVVLQLSWPFSFLHASHMWHFGDLPIASRSWDPVARLLWMQTTWVFFTLSHTQPLHNSHQVSNCWNYKQIWHGIKPTHDWINSTLPFSFWIIMIEWLLRIKWVVKFHITLIVVNFHECE